MGIDKERKIFRKIILFLCGIIYSYTTLLAANSNEMSFHYLTNIDGLSYSAVADIIQDETGFMWIATTKGLNMYDSNRIKKYYSSENENSLPANKINSLLYSNHGNLLIGTSKGLCIYNRLHDNFKRIKYKGYSMLDIHNITQTKNGVMVISSRGIYRLSMDTIVDKEIAFDIKIKWGGEDSFGNIWTHDTKKIYYINPDGNLLESHSIKVNYFGSISEISSAFIDSRGVFWIGTVEDGLFRFNRKTNKFEHIIIDSSKSGTLLKYIRNITEDQHGRLWIGTEKGLFIYNHGKDDYLHFQQSFDVTKSSLNDNAVYKIYMSRENIMWIGTYFGGVNYVMPHETGFFKMIPDDGRNSLKGKAVSKIISDNRNRLWIATEDKGISIYNPENKKYNYLLHNPADEKSLSGNNVHALVQDSYGFIWAGTYIDGLNRINIQTGEVVDVFKNSIEENSISNNSIYALYINSNRELFIGSMNGVDIYDFETGKFRRFKSKSLKGKHVDEIIEDRNGNIWFCTYHSGLYRYNYESDSLIHYYKGASNSDGLLSNSIICSQIDSKNRLWFGSRDGGLILYNKKTDSFVSFGTEQGIIDNDIYGILEDDEGSLWLSTNKGISKFNPENKSSSNYNTSHGLIANQYNFKSYYKDKNGVMYFGAVNGLTYFHPQQITTNSFFAKPHFTDFKLFNKTVIPGAGSILEKSINVIEEIILKEDQNVITFDFVAPNYYPIVNANYYFFMEGFETQWNKAVNNINSITYTNLNPGSYTFRVKVISKDNSIEEERHIRITVLPHPFLSITALLIYSLVFMLFVFFNFRFFRFRQKEKMILKMEKLEKENLKNLNKHKLNFFTYISHEFKTPLTIIIAALDDMLSVKEFPGQLQKSIYVVEKNAMRLQFLISQLMEFRQIETDHAPLQLYKIDIIKKLKNIFDVFSPLAEKKDIDFEFVSNKNSFVTSYDPDKLEKIVSNILSNACKHSNDYGSTVLNVNIDSAENIIIEVKNSGRGLTEKQQERIFEPFYKEDLESKDHKNSGIGLALVKSLVTLLKGKIEVHSKHNQGTTIKVVLPTGIFQNNAKAEESGKEEHSFTNSILALENEKFEESMVSEENDNKYEILVVEDNKDLLAFLKRKLGELYKIKCATNGIEAIKIINESHPDMVISDVMMPKMNGVELCKEIKDSLDTCHIPVILLTAKSEVDDRIEGLYAGADAYISKPFVIKELKLNIKNIIDSKNHLRNHFKTSGSIDIENTLTNKDEELIKRINSIVLKNMEDPDFDIDQLTKQAGVSRTVLHVKIKKIMGLSTSEFINTIRLNKAKELFSTTDLSIAEVAYMIGYREPNYFSRIFKKFFKISPSNFKKKIQEESTEVN